MTARDGQSEVPPFAIGSDVWPGLAKLAEECGELQQVIGKVMAYPQGVHPDGVGFLPDRLADEMGDVLGAIRYVLAHNALPGRLDRVEDREREKFKRFQRWDGEERRRVA